MANNVMENLREGKTWTRALYMVLFIVIICIVEVVAGAVVLFQFFAVLFTGKPNPKLLALGQSLSTYAYQLVLFLTFNTETLPYPMGAWPEGPPRRQ